MILFLLSVTAYITSLFLPFFQTASWNGIQCLLYGAYIGVDLDWNALFGILAWSANLVYLASLVTSLVAFFVVPILSKEIKESAGFKAFMLASGIIGATLLLSLCAFSYWYNLVRIDVLGNFEPVVYAEGYYFWIASFLFLSISSVPIGKKSKS